MRYVTVATKPHKNLDRLLERAMKYGWSVEVLGMGDKRLQEWGKGFGVKIECLQRFLHTVPPEELVLFTDAYDILPCDAAEEVQRRYQLLGAPPVLFAAEANCHPDKERSREYPPLRPAALYRYLNSGAFLGRAGVLKQLMESAPYKIADDDQRYWTTLYLQNRSLIQLDDNAIVFQCMANCEGDILWRDGRWVNKNTGIAPSFLHLNGAIKGRYLWYYALVRLHEMFYK